MNQTPDDRFWMVPRCFVGGTVAVLGSGPSMSQAVADAVRCSGLPAIVVNNTHRLAPWAWALYAADGAWWAHETNRDAHLFAGHKVSLTQIRGVRELRNTGRTGYDQDPDAVRTGCTSGYQATHVAAHTGATRILLFGMDYRNTGGEWHWHGEHVAGLRNTEPDLWPGWAAHFSTLHADLAVRGVEVINCTPGSAISCCRFLTLEEALRHEARAQSATA